MLMIRLQRMGKKKAPTYRVVINEKARDTQAKSLEILGHYSPTQDPKVLELNVERIKYWLSVGAQASETVHNLLVREGIVEGKKRKSVTITNKRKAKLEAKKAEAEEKKKEAEAAAAEAKAAEAEAKKAEAEAAAEEKVEEVKEEKPVEEKTEESKEEAPAEEKKEDEKPAEKEAEATEEKKEE